MRLLRSPLCLSLDDDWRDTLTSIAKERGFPTVDEPQRLGKSVASLSTAYNAGVKGELRSKSALAARLGFSFARDVPKSAGAVRELVATGALRLEESRALRILDLGSGLGASTWGVVRALESYGAKGRIEGLCIDEDEEALSVARSIAERRRGRGSVSLVLETRQGTLASRHVLKQTKGSFDVILLGQVLSELDAVDEPGTLALHADLVRSAAALLAPEGSLVIIEPALRDRTRHLHALRDAILDYASNASSERLNVFAPCLHASPCPALADPGAWCHEDLDVDLPPWLIPVANAAGLRWQGLTFSYLVLRKDGRTLRQASNALVRVVSEAIVTKGKREAFVCGDVLSEGKPAAMRVRAMRLDREASAANAAWGELCRGDVLALDPALDARKPRVSKDMRVAKASSLDPGSS